MISRRRFAQAIAAGVVCPPLVKALVPSPRPSSVIGGVTIGVESWSFHELTSGPTRFDEMIRIMQHIGLNEVELASANVEPSEYTENGSWNTLRSDSKVSSARERSRDWRLNVPNSYYESIREKFDRAGISVIQYMMGFNETFTDEERASVFRAAKALGARGCATSSPLSEVRRLAPIAEQQKMTIAVHNHNNLVDPDEFATPASFEKAFAISPMVRATLDIGHYTAANFDAVEFLNKHHESVTTVHLRDRKRNNGEDLAFGTGDAPIKEVLLLIRDKQWPIHCDIEYGYGTLRDSAYEIGRCFEYCKKVLA